LNYNRSFWEDALYDQRYDLIVIGAGITGQSSVYFFKQSYPDAKVLVIDRGHFPIGASTRNAGFACFGTIGEHIADLEIESEEKVKSRIRDRYEGLLLLREILGDENIEYEESGGWEIFPESGEFLKVKSEISRFNEWMLEILGEENVYEAKTYLGVPSVFNRLEGMLHPGKMIRTLHRKNIESGVEFRWNTEITHIDTESNKIQDSNELTYQSDRLIVASNAFTSSLLPKAKISPGRGYVMVTNELALMEWKGTFHYNKGYVYFRNVGEQRILLGGARNVDEKSEETSDFGINKSIKEYLVDFANEVLELPDHWEIEREWSGIMGFTPSKSPMLERAGKNCLVVAGLSGMGVAIGMQLGKKAAAEI
jgi:hypothetical protein